MVISRHPALLAWEAQVPRGDNHGDKPGTPQTPRAVPLGPWEPQTSNSANTPNSSPLPSPLNSIRVPFTTSKPRGPESKIQYATTKNPLNPPLSPPHLDCRNNPDTRRVRVRHNHPHRPKCHTSRNRPKRNSPMATHKSRHELFRARHFTTTKARHYQCDHHGAENL